MKLLKGELEDKRKEFGKTLSYSLLVAILIYIVLGIILKRCQIHYYEILSQDIAIIFFLTIVSILYLLSKIKCDFFKLYKLIALFLTLFVFNTSLQMTNRSDVIFLLYLPVILMTLMVTTFKKASIIAFLIIVLIFCTKPIALYFNITHPIRISEACIYSLNNLIIAFSIYLSFIIFYYNIEFYKIEFKDVKNSLSEEIDERFVNNIIKTESDDLEILYKRIINYLETEKPYQNPDFNLRILSKDLKTNASYTSKALNKYGNKNFNKLVNEYRINQTIQEIYNNIGKKYFIKKLYENAGFTQQSTFNRIFKEHTGKTPTEYIDFINSNDEK